MYINKLDFRSYGYIHPKNSHICIIHLVLERCYFEAVLPKRRLGPLEIKEHMIKYIYRAKIILKFIIYYIFNTSIEI